MNQLVFKFHADMCMVYLFVVRSAFTAEQKSDCDTVLGS